MPCHFCQRPSELFTSPPLCERHIELVLVRANLARTGINFNAKSAARELLRLARQNGSPIVCRPSELPELVGQMLTEDFTPVS